MSPGASARRTAGQPIHAAHRAWLAGLISCFLLAHLVGNVGVALASEVLFASPDVTIDLQGGDFADEDVAVYALPAGILPADLGALPSASALSAYERLADGDHLLCFDTGVELPGPVMAMPGDVVRYDGASYTIELDASANGIPNGAYCDAVTVDPEDRLTLSLDISVELPASGGGTLVANDEDLVQLIAASAFVLLDASPTGVPAHLDLDAAHIRSNGNLVASFDSSGEVGGVVFNDEDVLELDPGTGWSLLIDGSASDDDWRQADLDALSVAEPGVLLSLLAGAALLRRLGRTRQTRARRDPSIAGAGGVRSARSRRRSRKTRRAP